MSEKIIVEINGESYVWSGAHWYHAKNYQTPAQVIVRQLDAKLAQAPNNRPQKNLSFDNHLDEAKRLQNVHQAERAEYHVRLALKLKPDDLGALSLLSSVLRASGRSRQALEETQPYSKQSYPPLLTSRAAAYCDIGEWTKAKKTIGRVLAMGGGPEAFSVMRRIKQARPELYD